MKLKYLFGVVVLVALLLAAKAFLSGDPYLAALLVLMALASVINANRPEANKKTTFRDFVQLFVSQK